MTSWMVASLAGCTAGPTAPIQGVVGATAKPQPTPSAGSSGAGSTSSAGSSGAGSSGAGSSGPQSTSSTVRAPYVWWIVMENHAASQIIGHPDKAPFLDMLASTYGLATDYQAVTHPSEPNYIALTSGGTQGVTDDGIHDLEVPSLFSQLGSRWRAWQQDYPAGGSCFVGAQASGPIDLVGLPGTYARKHDPAISYLSVSRNAEQCALIQPLGGFDPAAAAFALITPNLENDMHDGTVAEGDAFLRAFVPRITGSAAFAAGGVLFITFDEGAGTDNQVATLMVRAGMPHGLRASASADHYSLLRTTEDLLGLPCLGAACTRPPIPLG